MVKFVDGIDLPYVPGAQSWLDSQGIGAFPALDALHPGLSIDPILSWTEQQIEDEQTRVATPTAGFKSPDFLSYRFVHVPEGQDPWEVCQVLMTWDEVEWAHVDPFLNRLPGITGLNKLMGEQGYLEPAPKGIGAAFAWDVEGGMGTGVGFCDLEECWYVDHTEFAPHSPITYLGEDYNEEGAVVHGTRTLGVVIAADNKDFGVGIAPNVDSVTVSSIWRPPEAAPVQNVYDALDEAIAALAAGDVLLIEVQCSLKFESSGVIVSDIPLECLPMVRTAIKDAVFTKGIVVVESAGNGNHDLAAVPDANGDMIFVPGGADEDDSGAIVVGAAYASVPHGRWVSSNHGERVNCYAWGEQVATTSTKTTGGSSEWTDAYSETSAASAIVAGAAVSVQGMALDGLGAALTPSVMRDYLGDTGINTKSADPPTDAIGVMPDLERIIKEKLGLAPEVYVRDHYKDEGLPHSWPLASSPDVILLKHKVSDPDASFGEGSGTELLDDLGETVLVGQPAVIYVRVRNRGKSPAVGVRAHVYWSEVDTLPTPTSWHPLGSVDLPDVPPGKLLTVTDPPLSWASVPVEGHKCFVVLLDSPWNPVPAPGSLSDFATFKSFIRDHPRATWRNFNVEYLSLPMLPPLPMLPIPDGFRAMPFRISGADDLERAFALEVLSDLPPGAEVMVDLPLDLLDEVEVDPAHAERHEPKGRLRLGLEKPGRTRIGKGRFVPRSPVGAHVLVRVDPKDLVDAAARICVRQLDDAGEEVGRVTWVLRP